MKYILLGTIALLHITRFFFSSLSSTSLHLRNHTFLTTMYLPLPNFVSLHLTSFYFTATAENFAVVNLPMGS
jgi:hypothetical protein